MAAIAPRRERLRTETHAEIRALAMAQVAAGGPPALSLNGIALGQMGVSGPALYRYYASRDALLGRLVADAFADLTGALARAVAQAAGRDPEGTLRAVAHAYRAWARAHAHEYALLTTGLSADGPRGDVEATSRRALDLVLRGLSAVAAPAAAPDPAPPWLRSLSVTVWQRLHGHLSLELEGIHAALDLDSDALFEDELAATIAETRQRWAAHWSRLSGAA